VPKETSVRRQTTFALAVIVLTGSAVIGQALPESKVPAAVRQAFHAKFPAVAKVPWKLKAPTYDAEFLVDGAEVTVKFDADGQWQETESAVPRAKVPAKVNDVIAKEFVGY
jgi:hypothetical protein